MCVCKSSPPDWALREKTNKTRQRKDVEIEPSQAYLSWSLLTTLKYMKVLQYLGYVLPVSVVLLMYVKHKVKHHQGGVSKVELVQW